MTNPPTATHHGVAISTSILVSQEMILRVNDIICGNGKKYRHTQGNEMYHILVCAFVDEYARQTSRKGKTMITKAIVEAIRMAKPPGRFLKKEKDGFFYEIGDRKSWVKTGQLLRDKVLEKKRKVNKKPSLNHIFAAISSKNGTPPPATISATTSSTTTPRQEYVSFITSFPPAPAPMFLPVAFNECHYDRSSSSVNTRLNHL